MGFLYLMPDVSISYCEQWMGSQFFFSEPLIAQFPIRSTRNNLEEVEYQEDIVISELNQRLSLRFPGLGIILGDEMDGIS